MMPSTPTMNKQLSRRPSDGITQLVSGRFKGEDGTMVKKEKNVRVVHEEVGEENHVTNHKGAAWEGKDPRDVEDIDPNRPNSSSNKKRQHRKTKKKRKKKKSEKDPAGYTERSGDDDVYEIGERNPLTLSFAPSSVQDKKKDDDEEVEEEQLLDDTFTFLMTGSYPFERFFCSKTEHEDTSNTTTMNTHEELEEGKNLNGDTAPSQPLGLHSSESIRKWQNFYG